MKNIARLKCSALKMIFIVIILGYGVIPVNAQYQKPEISMPSPNATSLGLYGEVPVSHFTGVPNINIPIYTLKNADISIPVNLSYHASGIQLDQRPGWVGLNWTLNAGGVITRTIKDLPDDYSNPEINIKRFLLTEYSTPIDLSNTMTELLDLGIRGYNAGYYFKHSINNTLNWAESTHIKDLAQGSADGWDTEPDKFSFNFLGYSGEFFLGEDGKWKVQSDDNIKVEINSENEFLDLPTKLQCSMDKRLHVYMYNGQYNIKTFGGFTITTDDGTRYVFGNTTNAIEYSIPFFYQYGEEWSATSWYLTKIISPKQNEIKLTYEPDSFISNMYISFAFNYTTLWHDKSKNIVQCGLYGYTYSFPGAAAWGSAAPYWTAEFGTETEHTADWINPRYDSYLGNLIRPVYLSKIESDNSEIIFTRSTTTELNYNPKIYLKNRFLYDITRSKTPLTRWWPVKAGELEERWPYLYEDVKSGDPKVLLTALNWKKLDNIQIKSKSNSNQGFKFTLTYNNNSSERLILKSIVQSTLDNSSNLPGYSFKYYDDVVLPGYLSEATDHWGFYNGNTQKSFTQPRTQNFHDNLTTIINNYSNTRNPTNNINVAQAGTLKEIIYPTGGKTHFFYEQNKYEDCISDNRDGLMTSDGTTKITGGIRICKIINDPGTPGESYTKEYLYVKNYQHNSDIATLRQSGILGGRIGYGWYSSEKDVDNNIEEIEKILFSSQSLLPMSRNSRGSHIGYSEVVEKLNNGSYSTFKYTNFKSEDGNHFDEPALPGSWSEASPFNPYSDKSFERGRLINQKIFNSNGLPVKETSTKYKKLGINPQDYYARGLMLSANQYQCAYGDMFLSYVGFPYKNYFYKYKIESEDVTWYNSSGNLIENKIFNYNTQNLIQSISTTNSNNATWKSIIKYPSDMSYGVYTTMATSNILNQPIEETTLNNDKIISSKLTTYKTKGSLFVPEKVCLLETTSPLSSFTYFDGSTKDSNYSNSAETEFIDYDNRGNPVEVLSKNGISTSYLWSYSYQYPIAHIKNATNTQVKTALGIDPETLAASTIPDMSKIDGLRTALPSALVTTYTYNPLVGMTSMTDPRGVTINYTYDTFNRLYLASNDEKNILSRYRYGYQNAPDNGQGGYTAPVATVTPGATSYLPGTTGTATLGSVSGGSGSYTYSWYLKTSTGTVLASNLNTTSTSFSFFCSQPGTLTIQCLITDNVTGLSSTASTTFISGVVPVYGNFYTVSGYTYPYTSLSKTGSYVTFLLVFLPTSSPMNVGTDYYIGEVSAGFRPSGFRFISYTTSGRTWNITINPDGSVYCRIVSGTNLPVGSAVAFSSLTYNL